MIRRTAKLKPGRHDDGSTVGADHLGETYGGRPTPLTVRSRGGRARAETYARCSGVGGQVSQVGQWATPVVHSGRNLPVALDGRGSST
jgi:hypothetical protein